MKKVNYKKISVSKQTRTTSNVWIFTVTFLVTLAILFTLGMVAYNHYLYSDISEPDSASNYEDILLEDAKISGYISNENSIHSIDFDPYGMENGIYTIYFDNVFEPVKAQGGTIWIKDKDLSTLHDETDFTDFTKRESIIIQSARDLVCKYIVDSDVLTNKEMLIQQIQKVPFYKYTDTTHSELMTVLDAPAVHMGIGIYCNAEFDEFFCEYMFVHELIHHLRYLTNDKNISHEKYFATAFDEALADIITTTINPKMFNNPDYIAGYGEFFEATYTYLSIFQEDALKAYFYGYNVLEDKYGGTTFETEHNLFVVALNAYSYDYEAYAVCDGLFHTWNTRLSEL